MRYKLDGDTVRFRGLSTLEYRALAPRGKWDKANQELQIPATFKNLIGIKEVFRIIGANFPIELQDLINKAAAVQGLVDAERESKKPSNAYDFDLKEGIKLYDHQVRAANMALFSFGVEPDFL